MTKAIILSAQKKIKLGSEALSGTQTPDKPKAKSNAVTRMSVLRKKSVLVSHIERRSE